MSGNMGALSVFIILCLSDRERNSGRRGGVHVRGGAGHGSYLRELVGQPRSAAAACDAVLTVR